MSKDINEINPKDHNKFIHQHIRFNFGACLVDSIGFNVGITFITIATVLPLFVRQLTDSNLLVGLIKAIASTGFFLPQILAARYIKSLKSKKPYLMTLAGIERIALLCLVPVTLWFAESTFWLLILFYGCWTLYNFSMGFNNPAYSTLITKIIPANRRGRLYGIGGAIGGALGIPASILVRHLLTNYGFPEGYALCFLFSFIALTISFLPLGFVREPILPVEPRSGWKEHLVSSFDILKTDRDFRLYIYSQIFFAFNEMAAAFYTVYAINHLGATEGNVAVFTGLIMATRIIINPFWGFMADKLGNRRVLVLGTCCAILAPILAITLRSLTPFHVVFVFNFIGASAVWLASFNIAMEFSGVESVTTYTALRSTLTAPARVIMPLVGGLIADSIGYNTVFGLATFMTVISLYFLLKMNEPREREVPININKPPL